MSNRAGAAIAAMTEPWGAFLDEVFPDGLYGPRRKGRHPGTDISERNRWMTLRVKQPIARNVWSLAKRARRKGAANAWCAGPVFLWAAGHYFDFALVILSAHIDSSRKLELLSYVESACKPTPPTASNLERKATLIAMGYDELEARAAMDEPLSANRRDRVVWELKDPEPVAFERAFARGSEFLAGSVAVAAFTCEAVMKHHVRGVDLQKAAVLEALRHASGQ